MMYQKKQKIIVIIALVIAIVGMTLGFAAFSATLNISSSANVTPNSADFDVKFYSNNTATLGPSIDHGISNTYVYSETQGGATATNVVMNSSTTSLSGLNANFTSPGQSVIYMLYAGNAGAYDAYLNSVNFSDVTGASSNKVCNPGTDATEALVNDACNAISISVDIDGTTVTDTKKLSNHILYKDSFELITITISYASDGERADGPFNVTFGDISLEYSTVNKVVNLITFQINGTTYQGEDGMSWSEWINSSYNTGNFTDATRFCSDENSDAGTSQYPYEDGHFFYGNSCTVMPF